MSTTGLTADCAAGAGAGTGAAAGGTAAGAVFAAAALGAEIRVVDVRLTVRVVTGGLAAAVRVTCLTLFTVLVAEVLAAVPVSEAKGVDCVSVGAGAVVSVGAVVEVAAGGVGEAAGGELSEGTGWAC
ncbi:MAG TPA: hypothetical protein VJ846_01125 [Sphingomicrobium sp.]|nr:hypothetical protein [Sphingomicrobium sp.]